MAASAASGATAAASAAGLAHASATSDEIAAGLEMAAPRREQGGETGTGVRVMTAFRKVVDTLLPAGSLGNDDH